VDESQAPTLVPVLASLYGDETWVIAAGIFNNGISLWCHQPHDTPRQLGSPNFTASLSDDTGTSYSPAGGSGAQDCSRHARYRYDFTPRPPAHAKTMRLQGRFNKTGQEGSLEFPVAQSALRVPEEIATSFGAGNRPRFVTSSRLVINPDGRHPVRIFGLEAWTEETALWAIWNSEKGVRYVLSTGGCRNPLGNSVNNTPPGVSAARIELPFALTPDVDRLEIMVRLRGTPGVEATGALLVSDLPGLDVS
jgi:hypothetical protein